MTDNAFNGCARYVQYQEKHTHQPCFILLSKLCMMKLPRSNIYIIYYIITQQTQHSYNVVSQ